MKKKLCCILIFFASCTLQRQNSNKSNEIELIKQLAYCKCMENSIRQFVGKDSTEASLEEIIEMMDSKHMFTKLIYPFVDSIAKGEVEFQVKNKSNFEGKHTDELVPKGNTNYINNCLSLYNSRQLDSLIRKIPKSMYMVQNN